MTERENPFGQSATRWRSGRLGTRQPPGSPAASAASFKRAGQVQQLGGESPLHNLMEVKC